jgi:pyridoxal phosphate enzyme (YggS family)
MSLIHDNIVLVKSKIAGAASRSGRRAEEVQLMAVTKTFSAEIVREAVDEGLHVLGENRVQELLAKRPLLPSTVQWHLIGHLQSNKVRKVLPVVEAIHSVDNVDIAADINRIATELGLFPKVYLEVNVAGESTKFGFDPRAMDAVLEQLLTLERLEIQGLMCVPPYTENEEENRKHFVRLRELRDRLETKAGIKLPGLSMGMSGDYAVAVEEGATIVRVGSAIFGSR